jgi:hypothetical protein
VSAREFKSLRNSSAESKGLRKAVYLAQSSKQRVTSDSTLRLIFISLS